MVRALLRRKSIESNAQQHLKPCLTATDLTLMGVGAIIGAGVFVLTGVAAATKAGPAIVLSYIISGLTCALTALSYAELAASIGGCGSAYGYAYIGMGEIFAWVIGWALVIEYGISCAVVAIGWSGYLQDILASQGMALPFKLTHALFAHHPQNVGFIDLPAVLIVLLMTGLLATGAKLSAHFNKMMVAVKVFVIVVFLFFASRHVEAKHWHPFMPFGFQGVIEGASLIFFAYIGFDAVSTASEEAINPQRDVPIGIIASLIICTLIYIVIAGLLTGIVPYQSLNTASPVAKAMLDLGHTAVAALISVGAMAGLTTVVLVMFFGLTRIFYAMSRDGLLPPVFSKLHPKTHSPIWVIIISGLFIAALSGFASLGELAELVNIGTLAAFMVACYGVIILRKTLPDLHRPFKTPFYPAVPILGIFSCLYLMAHLPLVTWIRFFIWMLLGLVIYAFYGRRHSVLALQHKK